MHSFRTYLSEMGNPDKDFIEDGVRWVQFRHNTKPVPHHDDANLKKAFDLAKSKGQKVKVWNRNSKSTFDAYLLKDKGIIIYKSGNKIDTLQTEIAELVNGVWDLKQGFKNIAGTAYKDYLKAK